MELNVWLYTEFQAEMEQLGKKVIDRVNDRNTGVIDNSSDEEIIIAYINLTNSKYMADPDYCNEFTKPSQICS